MIKEHFAEIADNIIPIFCDRTAIMELLNSYEDCKITKEQRPYFLEKLSELCPYFRWKSISKVNDTLIYFNIPYSLSNERDTKHSCSFWSINKQV